MPSDAATIRTDAVRALREIGFWLERERADTYRVRAYRNAADALAMLSDDEIELLAAARAWQDVPGLGPKTASVVSDVSAGRMPRVLTELREQGAAPLAEAGRELRSSLRGDLHTHSTWSDGGSPVEEMVATAARLGHEYIAVTDHSPRLTVAHGLSRERLLAQWQEIDALAATAPGIRILKGIEVDILADGGLDQAPDLLDRLDVVVASVHSDLRADATTMTRRMVAAIASPYANVLGHCTGRLITGGRGTRPESSFDAEVVFEACRRFDVAVEINSRPERLDPPMRLLRLAKEIGCLFSIDTDAHAPGQLDFLDYGCARASEAGVDPDRIVTAWPLSRLLAWTRSRR